jgi:hypothetical protein
MGWVRTVVLGGIVALFAGLVLPPYVDLRRTEQAVAALEALSDAAGRFRHDTGQTCPAPRALLADLGTPGWRGPYIESEALLHTPWGGDYVFDAQRGLVGIGRDNARVPAKYRLGGIAELSLPIRDNPQWWPTAHGAGR